MRSASSCAETAAYRLSRCYPSIQPGRMTAEIRRLLDEAGLQREIAPLDLHKGRHELAGLVSNLRLLLRRLPKLRQKASGVFCNRQQYIPEEEHGASLQGAGCQACSILNAPCLRPGASPSLQPVEQLLLPNGSTDIIRQLDLYSKDHLSRPIHGQVRRAQLNLGFSCFLTRGSLPPPTPAQHHFQNQVIVDQGQNADDVSPNCIHHETAFAEH